MTVIIGALGISACKKSSEEDLSFLGRRLNELNYWSVHKRLSERTNPDRVLCVTAGSTARSSPCQSFNHCVSLYRRTQRKQEAHGGAMDDEMEAAAASAAVRWSDLQPEIWAKIVRHLDSHTDLLRFRSVCSMWRSLVPRLPLHQTAISVPHTVSRVASSSASISSATIFRIEPVPKTSMPDDPLPYRQGWLIKISDSKHELVMEPELGREPESDSEPQLESNSGKLRLLNPLCGSPILYKAGTFLKHLDLLKFRATELCKEYSLRGAKGLALAEVEKVLICPDSPWRDPEDTLALSISKDGNLRYWKYGEESWTHITDGQDQGSWYDDIIVYKGQFYVVDKLGTVSWIDSSMRAIQFSPPMCGGGDRKYLVEWGSDIFVIDRYHEGLGATSRSRHRRRYCLEEVVDFKVYRLDQEWGKWDEVNNLGDVVFFLGTRCSFSVSVRDFNGCPGNCIYFAEQDRFRYKVHVFNLGNRSVKRAAFLPAYMQILWPPPSWLTPIPCLLDPNVPVSIF